MNPPNDPPEVNVNGQTSSVERPQTSAAIAAKSSAGKNVKRNANVLHIWTIHSNLSLHI